jgi:hypothetical protein
MRAVIAQAVLCSHVFAHPGVEVSQGAEQPLKRFDYDQNCELGIPA